MHNIIPCSKNSIRLAMQCLSYSDHMIIKGGYSSAWRGMSNKAKKPSLVVVYKPDASGELVRIGAFNPSKKVKSL